MTCLHCYAETSNGLALCEKCRMATSIYLEFLPVYFRNLARWRPGQAGSRPVPGSRAPKGVFPAAGDPVSNALDEIGADLAGWAQCLSEERGVDLPAAEGEASVVRVTCWLFAEHLTSISTLEWAGEFVRMLGEHEARLRALTEKVAPGWYSGACRQTLSAYDEAGEREVCGHPTHVVPGLTWVTCGSCGATTYARDHLDTILDEARDWVARPRALAEAIVALVDTEQSVDKLHTRIRQWAHQDDLLAIRQTRLEYKWDDDAEKMLPKPTEFGPARYHFGEVFDRLMALYKSRRVEQSKAAS